MRIAAVIPNWNGSAMLGELLSSLAQQSQSIDRVVVVDNGSSDDSVAAAQRAGAEVIQLPTNVGFSRAVNVGIQAARADYIAILNNDVSLDRSWLANLVQAIGAGDVWFASGKLLDPSGHFIDGTFDALCRGACAWRCGNGRPDSPLWNQPRQIHFPPLTAALFRAELFERVGLLDEAFESYLEDVDLGLRCAMAGLNGAYVPASVAYHTGSSTLGRWHSRTVRNIARNQLLLISKHYPRNWVLRYGWPVFVAQALWGLVALRHGTGSAYVQGKLDGMRRFRQTRGQAGANFAAVVERSEREILELQKLTGFDPYWRLYFALT